MNKATVINIIIVTEPELANELMNSILDWEEARAKAAAKAEPEPAPVEPEEDKSSNSNSSSSDKSSSSENKDDRTIDYWMEKYEKTFDKWKQQAIKTHKLRRKLVKIRGELTHRDEEENGEEELAQVWKKMKLDIKKTK